MKLSKIERNKFHKRRIAQRAVGASTARGRPMGTVSVFQEAFNKISLDKFGAFTSAQYITWLNRQTKIILRNWNSTATNYDTNADCAMVRKCLNIFLADIVQHSDISTQYKLKNIKKFLEVPIDSHTAEGVLQNSAPIKGWRSSNNRKVKWHGIKRLNKQQHNAFQEIALELAKQLGIFRYELDALYWRPANNKINKTTPLIEYSIQLADILTEQSTEARWWLVKL